MKFKLEFDMDNNAFWEDDKLNIHEIKSVLDYVQHRVEYARNGNAVDINGNKIGQWEITDNES